MKLQPTQVRQLTGYMAALPTPFRDDTLDEHAFSRLCEWQIGQGTAALVVAGTTGEAPTLSTMEQGRLIRLAAQAARGRVPVIAGAGSNSTRHAIELAELAVSSGADALLCVVPYYNKPTQEGLYGHFSAIHDAVELPVLLYDVPSRTCCSLALDTIVRLAELPRIVGLKDASGDLSRPARLRRALGHEFRLFTGDDATALGFFALGGDGCISVTANVAPRLCAQLHDAWRQGATEEAETASELLVKLTDALFAETSPVPVKYALELMGFMSSQVRLPLCAAAESTRCAVAEVLTRLSLIGPRPVSRRVPVAA
ncbi:MAG TPA: 4-hydroxy-tetrahydrodipicolinate synthase [Aliidongia sp.]|nr:4-hydroxy-tetrahydrodipicolinate synthase [Aliidongia sp.]